MWLFKNKEKIPNYVLTKELNRYQIQVYDFNNSMILINVYTAFSFDEACEKALEELKLKVDIAKILTPIKFFYSGTKNK